MMDDDNGNGFAHTEYKATGINLRHYYFGPACYNPHEDEGENLLCISNKSTMYRSEIRETYMVIMFVDTNTIGVDRNQQKSDLL